MRIRGLYPAVATPVRSDGSVDLAAFDRLCEFVLERGAYTAAVRHPIAALGMAVIAAGALAFAGGLMRHRTRAR